MYKDGFDFWADLLREYGKEEALRIANSYLDMQIHNTDTEEHIFCCELYWATQGKAA